MKWYILYMMIWFSVGLFMVGVSFWRSSSRL